MTILNQSYDAKSKEYFSGVRKDLIDRLEPAKSRAILEIGCGDGSTGAYAKSQAKCTRYVGIELSSNAAQLAERLLDKVYVANVETFDVPERPESFDVLIASEVLEHLVDPWRVLKRLNTLLRPGATVFASSPNAAHYTMIRMLLAGRWDLTESGRMDRTHLRWFTPQSYARMFRDCGFDVISIAPIAPPGYKAKVVNSLTGHRWEHLFIGQIVVCARKPLGAKAHA